MLDRLLNILKGTANKGLSKMETPEILAEQADLEYQTNLKKLMEAIVAGVTREKSLEQKLNKAKEELATWEKRAVMSVQQNNDDIARQCIQKKQELTGVITANDAQLTEQKATNVKLKQQRQELEQQYEAFKRNKANLTGRLKAADGVTKANEILSKTGGSSMDKWEEKISEKENRASALREAASSGPSDNDLKQLDQKIQVDDELAALKAKMSAPKAAETPAAETKLIASGEKNEEHRKAAQPDDDVLDVEVEP
jgi:phage shock protein A